MNIRGTEGLSAADLQSEIARGARFVAYQWCLSLLVVTLKRTSRIYYLKPGQTGFGPGFLWSLFSLVAGWWGFPWGPIYTIAALWTNVRGGLDVTAAVSADLAATHRVDAPPPLPGSFASGPRWVAGPLAALGVFIAAILAAVTGAQHYAQQHRPVALVNGLDSAYAAEIDGVPHQLRPHSVIRLEMPEGPHALAATLPGGVGPTTFTFTVGEATVVNPDSAALVTEETMIYTATDKPRIEGPNPRFHSGQTAYSLSTPDCFLDEFPETIKLSSGSSQTSQTRIAVYPEVAIDQTAGIVLRNSGRPALVAYLKSLGHRLPSNQDVLGTAAQALEPAEARAFFAQHLATRPLLIDWHRYYQNYIQLRQPDVDLITEYRRLAEAEPDDGALAYLHGRLLEAPAQARTWYERALAAKRPCAYAHFALSFDAAARGDFTGALALLDRARLAGLDTAGQRSQRINYLLSLHRFDEALREFKTQPQASATDFEHATEALQLHYLAGGKPAAEQSINAFVAGLPPSTRRQSGDAIRKSLASRLAYFEGDPATYAASFTNDAPPAGRFTASLCRNDLAAAESALTELPVQLSSSWFMLHLAARLTHDAKAATYWDKAVAALAGEPNGHRLLAAHLRGTAPLPVTEIIDFPMGDAEKRIFLAALGLHDPTNRAACFARAAQFNVSLQFPHHLVTAALATAQP